MLVLLQIWNCREQIWRCKRNDCFRTEL